MASDGVVDARPDRAPARAIAMAASITVLDGFDAFSLSLMAPKFSKELGIATNALGTIFSSAMAGMIIGALCGGALADRLGRVRVLAGALCLFGLTALLMPWMETTGQIIVNRAIGGVGLGAAAPIAIALLARSARKPPREFILAVVWSGIGIGGMIAATFNFFIVTHFGWRSMFVVGGVLPIPLALAAFWGFRDQGSSASGSARAGGVAQLFVRGEARRTILTAAIFFFGYITTSVVVNWLPTILNHRHASNLVISIAFGGLNAGGMIGTCALGLAANRARSGWALPLAWLATGVFGFIAALPLLGNMALAIAAIAGASLGAGSQALSVAYASKLHSRRQLESTTVGLVTAVGRVGQVCALSLSGALIALGIPENGIFAVAGSSAIIAGIIAVAGIRNGIVDNSDASTAGTPAVAAH